MGISIFPTPTAVSGDPASQTFAVGSSGTYTLSTPLAAGLYEITTDTSQSSFTLGFKASAGYLFTGTIRGGKGFVSVPVAVNQISVPSLSFPANINIRLGAFTQIAAPTSASFTYVTGNTATYTFTAPSGATDIVAYFTDGTSTAFSTTTSPKTGINTPGTPNSYGTAVLVAKDASGVIGLGATVTSTNTIYIPFSGGTVYTYSSGGTNYFMNFFTDAGTLTINNAGNYDIALVAGGAGGGGNYNGARGGTGGSILAQTGRSMSTGTYAIAIGGGGGPGGAGGSTTFNGLTATGRSGKDHSQGDSGGATGSGTWTSSGIGGAGAGGGSTTKSGGPGRNALGGFTFPTGLGDSGYFSGGGAGYQSGYGSAGTGTTYGAGGRALDNYGNPGMFMIRAVV